MSKLNITNNLRSEEFKMILKDLTLDRIDVSVFWMDHDGKFIFVNSAAMKALGYEEDELIGMHVFDIDPDYPKEVWPKHWSVLKEEGRMIIESHHRRNDGYIYPVEIRINYIKIGNLEFNVAIAADITKRKEYERIRNEREHALRDIHASLMRILKIQSDDFILAIKSILKEVSCTLNIERVSFWKLSVDKSYIYCLDLYARSEDRHSVGMILESRHYKEYFKALNEHRIIVADDALHDPHTSEFAEEYLKPLEISSMVDVPVWLHGNPAGVLCSEHVGTMRHWTDEERHYLVSVSDMLSTIIEGSERQIAEDALRAQEYRSSALIKLAPNIIVGLGDDSTIEIFNDFAERLTGYKASEVLGKRWIDIFIPEESRDRIREVWTDVLNSQAIQHSYDNVIITKTGKARLISWSNTVINNNGEFNIVLSIGQDVTDRRAAERRLRESEHKYRSLVESANDAIFLVSCEDNIIIDTNTKAETITNLSRNELIGNDYCSIFEPDQCTPNALCKHRTSKYKRGNYVTTFNSKHSGEIPMHVSWSIISFNESECYLLILRDITELKAVEDALKQDKSSLRHVINQKTTELRGALKQLEHEKRLSDIGRLGATIAHELRNPLGVIRTATYNIIKKCPNQDIEKHIESIERKIVQSDQIIRNLLSYSRIKMPYLEKFCLPRFVDTCIDECFSRDKCANINIIRDYNSSDNIEIEADRVQINELIHNLGHNACQAIGKRGGEVRIKISIGSDAKTALLSMSDNGCGMDQSELAKAFEPFFTTKATGIGLGLTVCQQVVQLHNGKIIITSKKGLGTTVDVRLPLKQSTSENLRHAIDVS